MARIPLMGSERSPLAGSRVTGPADPSENVRVSVLVRRRGQQEFKERVARLAAGDTSIQPLSREEFAQRFGADPSDVAAVKTFAASHGLTVIQENPARRTVVLT